MSQARASAAGSGPAAGVTLLADADATLTGEAVALEVRPAALVSRALSGLIDWLCYALLLLLMLLGSTALAESGVLDEAMNRAVTVLIVAFAFVLVPLGVEQATRGRSLGRLALGYRIVRADGGAVSLRQSTIRAVLGVVEIPFTLGAGAALAALLSPRGQRFGDLLAGSYAQNERLPQLPQSQVVLPPQLEQWAALADVARLPDRLSRRISRLLAEGPRMLPQSRHQHTQALLAEAAPYISPMPQADPETILRGVVALRYRRSGRQLELAEARLEQLDTSLSTLPYGFPRR